FSSNAGTTGLTPLSLHRRSSDLSGAGSFLDKLAPRITAYGLEPSRASVEQGRARGRKLLRPDADGWSRELPDNVDVITLFDVIRSEEHTSELQSPCNLVCRLLLE